MPGFDNLGLSAKGCTDGKTAVLMLEALKIECKNLKFLSALLPRKVSKGFCKKNE